MSECTWEPKQNLLDCGLILPEFERRQAKLISRKKIRKKKFMRDYLNNFPSTPIDARQNNNRIEYSVQQLNNCPSIVIPSVEAFETWPALVLDFLEQSIGFIKHEDKGKRVSINELVESHQCVGNPIGVSCHISIEHLIFRCLTTFNQLMIAPNGKSIKTVAAISIKVLVLLRLSSALL